MSHFCVLVIGPDIEAQLAPFHEFECTGLDDEFIQEVDTTSQYKTPEDWKADYDKEPVASIEQVDLAGAHKYGYAIAQGDKLIKAVRRTNPNKKWDYWLIGGRWSGWMQAKGGPVSQCRKADLDLDTKRKEKAAIARSNWDGAHAAISRLAAPLSWVEARAKFGEDVEKARKFYREQPAIMALEKWNHAHDYPMGPLFQWEQILVPRDTFVQEAERTAFLPFAFIKDRQWFERGSMGWWGMVSDEKNPQDWAAAFTAMFGALPDDTLLTVVDCHI